MYVLTGNQTDLELDICAGKVLLHRGSDALHISLPYRGAYGMGKKFNNFNQKGQTVVFQGEKTYCSTPFFWTDTGFGLYADTYEVTTFSFWETEIVVYAPDYTEYKLFTGTPEEILCAYMELFGKAVLPPDWIFKPWISANHWKTQKDAEMQLEKLKE